MKHNKLHILPLLLAALFLCGACAAPGLATLPQPDTAPDNSATAAPLPPAAQAAELAAVFFDVGQAESILISSGGRHMLVDAGNIGQDALLTGYLEAYGVAGLDYLVATHPHADHIGAMAAVVYAMADIGTVLMPEAITTTATFENLLDAIERRGLEITVPEAGDVFRLGEATVEVLAPLGSGYDDLNNYSIVLRVSYGQASFLLTGDAEALSESEQLQAEQLQAGRKLSAQVLKVGHHGSSSGSTADYLDAVAPTYAVISCGADNSYGHPHAEVLSRLNQRHVEIYRTDECGTIEIVTDGEFFTVTTTKKATPAVTQPGV